MYDPDEIDACYKQPCHEVYDRIFVGSLRVIHDPKEIENNEITHVVSCLNEYPVRQIIEREASEKVMTIFDSPKTWLFIERFDDRDNVKIGDIVKRTNKFISEAMKDKNAKVLIHCSAGVSRSASIAIAYIMTKEKSSLNDILTKMREKRCILNPNLGFRRQLIEIRSLNEKSDDVLYKYM